MKVTKAEYSAGVVQREFWNDFRELNANFSDVHAGIVAYLQLNYPEDLIAISKESNPSLYRRILTEALVMLIDRGALVQLSSELTGAAVTELANLRRETGIGLEMLPAPPAPQPTEQERLEQRVVSDWKALKSADFKRNCANDRKYRETFERLAAENRLDSVATFHHDLRSLVS